MKYGVPEAAKEALLVALIGFLTLNGRPSTIPSCTGARRATVLGSITPGRSYTPALPGGHSGEVTEAARPRALVVGPPEAPR